MSKVSESLGVGDPKELLFQYFIVSFGERGMDEESLVAASQLNCDHQKQELYTERCFDILNGFELVFTRCINCHKVLSLDAKKFESH